MARAKTYRMILNSNYNGHVAAFLYNADDARASDESIATNPDLDLIGEVASYDRRDGIATLANGDQYAVYSDRSSKPLTAEEADAQRAERGRERDALAAAKAAYAEAMKASA